jgi:hypothetical protein
MMETKAEEPEHDFLLEERVTSLLLFTTWSVRNFKLKGRSLYYDEEGHLHHILSTIDSVSNKLLPSEADGKEFPFQITCKDGSTYSFNAISEEIREKAITLMNFSSRTAKWFYPYEELVYKDHATLEVVGLPNQKPIYIPPKTTNNITEATPQEQTRINLKQKLGDRSGSPLRANDNNTAKRTASPLRADRAISPVHRAPTMDSPVVKPNEVHIKNAPIEPVVTKEVTRSSIVEI